MRARPRKDWGNERTISKGKTKYFKRRQITLHPYIDNLINTQNPSDTGRVPFPAMRKLGAIKRARIPAAVILAVRG